jgi:hypothetical protein
VGLQTSKSIFLWVGLWLNPCSFNPEASIHSKTGPPYSNDTADYDKYDHITPALKELHWIRLPYITMVTFNVATLILKMRHLRDLVTICLPVILKLPDYIVNFCCSIDPER